MARTAGAPPVLVGREDEERAIAGAVASAAAGAGRAVVVEGPPGIGKTRLRPLPLGLPESADLVRDRLGEAADGALG
jgi:AAA ATPase domain